MPYQLFDPKRELLPGFPHGPYASLAVVNLHAFYSDPSLELSPYDFDLCMREVYGESKAYTVWEPQTTDGYRWCRAPIRQHPANGAEIAILFPPRDDRTGRQIEVYSTKELSVAEVDAVVSALHYEFVWHAAHFRKSNEPVVMHEATPEEAAKAKYGIPLPLATRILYALCVGVAVLFAAGLGSLLFPNGLGRPDPKGMQVAVAGAIAVGFVGAVITTLALWRKS